jgi:hypothetical protein
MNKIEYIVIEPRYTTSLAAYDFTFCTTAVRFESEV